MSQQQVLRAAISNLSETEAARDLQARPGAAGLKTNLSVVPAARVPETFREAMLSLLERPVAELAESQVRAITGEVNATTVALRAYSQS